MGLYEDSIKLSSHVFPKYLAEAKSIAPKVSFSIVENMVSLVTDGVLYDVIGYFKENSNYVLRLHVSGMPDKYQSTSKYLDLDDGFIDIVFQDNVGLLQIDIGNTMTEYNYVLTNHVDVNGSIDNLRFSYDDVGIAKSAYLYEQIITENKSAIMKVRYFFKRV